MRRRVFAIYAAAVCALAAPAAEDPREIVRRAMSLHQRNDEVARNYTFLMRQETRGFDGSGSVNRRDSKTWDITLLEGSPYRRLVQRNDKPLPAKEEQQEEAKLRQSIEQRRKETPEQRQQRIAGWDRSRKKQLDELREIPDAFDFRLIGEEMLEGVPVWVIEGAPHPGYKPKSKASAYYTKMKGRIWIAKSDYQPVKIEGETIETISLGAFLVRVGKGAHLRLDFSRVNGEVWLPKSAAISGSARVLLVKGLRIETDFSFSNYKKFSAESRVVE